MKRLLKKIQYYFYAFVNKVVTNASSQVKLQHISRAATFDSTVSINGANVTNAQNDKSKITIGKNSIIQGTLIVFGFGGKIEIGENSFVGPNSHVWSAKSIRIGSYVLISHNVNVIDNISHPKNHIERMKDWDYRKFVGFQKTNDFEIKEAEIIIEDNVWIGYNSSIHRGVKIGKGAIIGANTIVTKDVPPFAILVGNPSQIIGYTD